MKKLLIALFLFPSLVFAQGVPVGPSSGGGSGTVTSITAGASGCLTVTPSPITTTGTIDITANPFSGACGGTGVANTGKTITLGGNLATTGAFDATIALSASVTATWPGTSFTAARTDAGQTFTGTNVFGVLQGTSLALGGATIGTNALAVTGTIANGSILQTSATQLLGSIGSVVAGNNPGISFVGITNTGLAANSGNLALWVGGVIGLNLSDRSLPLGSGGYTFRVPSDYAIGWASATNNNAAADVFLTRSAAATLQVGATDVDTGPVAQTLRTQGTLAGGTSNVAGANFTVAVSPGKGTGAGGSYIVQVAPAGSTGTAVNALATAVTIDSTKLATFVGNITVPNMTVTATATTFTTVPADTAQTDSTACLRSSDGLLMKGVGTLGICLGTSSARYKTDIAELDAGLSEIIRLPSKSFRLDAAHGDPAKKMFGFIAEDCAKVLPQLTGYDSEGRANTCDYLGVVPVLVHAMQEQQAQIEALKVRLQ